MDYNYFQKRRKAFGYAWNGIIYLFRNEAHAKIHLLAAVCVIAAGVIFGISRWEWCSVLLCIGGVFMAESFNTAIEKISDKVSKERDPLIKIAKDVGAGAVLLFVMASVAVGFIVFLPYIIALF